MADWIDGSANTVVADDSLHAGVTVELMRNNLIKAQNESGFDISCFHHDGDAAIAQAVASANDFELFSNFNPLVIVLRQQEDTTTFRNQTLSIDGKSSSGTATVRIYYRRSWDANVSVDTTDGFLDETEFAEFTFSSTSYATASDSFIPQASSSIIAPVSGITMVVAYIVVVFTATTTATVSLRNLRIRESAT
jgi:hypothetical protein